MRSFAVACFLASTVVACSGGDFQIPAGGDGAASDDSSTDVASGGDSTAVVDDGVEDSTNSDGAASETTSDTRPMDAKPEDTKRDTAFVDVGKDAPQGTDTKPPSDGAGGCPRPASTATFDGASLNCEKLALAYHDRLAAAQECQCAGECGTTIAVDFCDNCSAAVNPATDAYAQMVSIRKQWNVRVGDGECTPPVCTAGLCPQPKTGVCTPQFIGSTCRDLSTTT